MEAFHKRLQSLMEERGISQSELCVRTGIPKSALSQYVSGVFKPKQERTYLLAKALDVSPAWLMGYDVPRAGFSERTQTAELTERELEILTQYRINDDLRSKIDRIFQASGRSNRHHDPDSDDATDVFRAAKSSDGKKAPARVKFSRGRLDKIKNAPETDEDL